MVPFQLTEPVAASDGSFSASDSTTSIVATALAATPMLSGSIAYQGLQLAGSPFAGMIFSDANLGVSDTLVIRLYAKAGDASTDADGVLSGAGLTKTAVGTYTLSGSPTVVSAELKALKFSPTRVGSAQGETASITATDNYTIASGTSVTTPQPIPNTALTFSGAVANQATSDAAAMSPFAHMSVSDPNIGAVDTLTVTVSASAGGTPTDADGVLSGAGLTKTAVGTYTLTGSPATVSAELQALSFKPTQHQVTPGSSVTTHLTVAASDGSFSASDSTTSVVATAANTVSSPSTVSHGEGSSETLHALSTGDQFVIGGPGTDTLDLQGNTSNYSYQTVDLIASASNPAIQGYEFTSSDGLSHIYVDHSVELIHFANGQVISLGSIPNYLHDLHG